MLPGEIAVVGAEPLVEGLAHERLVRRLGIDHLGRTGGEEANGDHGEGDEASQHDVMGEQPACR